MVLNNPNVLKRISGNGSGVGKKEYKSESEKNEIKRRVEHRLSVLQLQNEKIDLEKLLKDDSGQKDKLLNNLESQKSSLKFKLEEKRKRTKGDIFNTDASNAVKESNCFEGTAGSKCNVEYKKTAEKGKEQDDKISKMIKREVDDFIQDLINVFCEDIFSELFCKIEQVTAEKTSKLVEVNKHYHSQIKEMELLKYSDIEDQQHVESINENLTQLHEEMEHEAEMIEMRFRQEWQYISKYMQKRTAVDLTSLSVVEEKFKLNLISLVNGLVRKK